MFGTSQDASSKKAEAIETAQKKIRAGIPLSAAKGSVGAEQDVHWTGEPKPKRSKPILKQTETFSYFSDEGDKDNSFDTGAGVTAFLDQDGDVAMQDSGGDSSGGATKPGAIVLKAGELFTPQEIMLVG